jgi:hypothetical protein
MAKCACMYFLILDCQGSRDLMSLLCTLALDDELENNEEEPGVWWFASA